ncbi:PEP-CTERM sorting domain-containing protein [Psychromonas sp. MME2]|uniref:PEP-CTERM sorting domain-containing protein n=1 Tax=unclassified Psychromonas TaxID=2614957 RepID=UPI00339C2F4B
MKGITKIVMLASAFAINTVQAKPVTINYTVDNTMLHLGLCANTGCTDLTNPTNFSTLFSTGANVSNWQNADSFTLDLAPGTYEFGFVVNNFGIGSTGNPAGLLAEILWDGNINVSSSAWDVTTNGVDFVSATEWARNGTGIWGNKLLGEISSDAKWLWTENNFSDKTENIAAFRTSITVPAPATLGILGLGLFGLGLLRKRSA